jgi:hypothetical protein
MYFTGMIAVILIFKLGNELTRHFAGAYVAILMIPFSSAT